MTLDEITSALKSSDAVPLAALRASLANAEELGREFFNLAQIKSMPNQVHAFVYELLQHIAACKRSIIRM